MAPKVADSPGEVYERASSDEWHFMVSFTPLALYAARVARVHPSRLKSLLDVLLSTGRVPSTYYKPPEG